MEPKGINIFWALKFGISIWSIDLSLKCKKYLAFCFPLVPKFSDKTMLNTKN